METTIIWCGWPDCAVGFTVTGDLLGICPACGRLARWTTTQPYRLNWDDIRFLRSLRIDPEVAA